MAAITIIPESVFTSSLWFRAGETNILDEPVPANSIWSYEQFTPYIEDAEEQVSQSMSPLGYNFLNAQITASSTSGSIDDFDYEQGRLHVATVDKALALFFEVTDKPKAPKFHKDSNMIMHKLRQDVIDPPVSGSQEIRTPSNWKTQRRIRRLR